MGNVVETCLTMSKKENGQPTKFNENQRESMLALKEKVATLLYVGDRPPRPLLHKAHHITICTSGSLQYSDQHMHMQGQGQARTPEGEPIKGPKQG